MVETFTFDEKQFNANFPLVTSIKCSFDVVLCTTILLVKLSRQQVLCFNLEVVLKFNINLFLGEYRDRDVRPKPNYRINKKLKDRINRKPDDQRKKLRTE